jgi:hypothetical protein
MTRALFLLWKAIYHFRPAFIMPVANIGQIHQGTVRRMLVNYIRKAGCVHDSEHGGRAAADRALAVFQAHPYQFLGDNRVFVNGSPFLDNGQDPENVHRSAFEYNPARDRYEFSVRRPVLAGAAEIQVESVTAFHWTDPRYVPRPMVPPPPPLDITTTDFDGMTGIRLSGVHPMVTTQFTGCAFCMAEHGGHMYCAHVAPGGPNMAPRTDGPTLASRVIATHGAFVNANDTRVEVYGRLRGGPLRNPRGYDLGEGDANYMTIVGFPGGTSYNIFAQTTRNGQVAEVTQIF